MSSKLVKKQLSALLSGGVSEKKASSSRRRSKKKSKQQLGEAAAPVQPVVESNLKYYRRTKAPSAATKDLLAQVPSARLRHVRMQAAHACRYQA